MDKISTDNYYEALLDGTIGGMMGAVFRAFRDHGPCTSAEALAYAGVMPKNRNLGRARVAELRNAGALIVDGLPRRDNITGRTAAVLRAIRPNERPIPRVAHTCPTCGTTTHKTTRQLLDELVAED